MCKSVGHLILRSSRQSRNIQLHDMREFRDDITFPFLHWSNISAAHVWKRNTLPFWELSSRSRQIWETHRAAGLLPKSNVVAVGLILLYTTWDRCAHPSAQDEARVQYWAFRRASELLHWCFPPLKISKLQGILMVHKCLRAAGGRVQPLGSLHWDICFQPTALWYSLTSGTQLFGHNTGKMLWWTQSFSNSFFCYDLRARNSSLKV